MKATRKDWSEKKDVNGHVRKFGLIIQPVRNSPGQSEDPQAGNRPCSGTGNRSVDA